MADDTALTAMFEYYARGGERSRLDEPDGQLEFARTTQIIARHLPAAPATVADIGGGPGRYARWLAGLGYRVLHRDLMPLHVEQLRAEAAGNPQIDSAVADARDPGLEPGSADAVLLLGPLYHLERRADRLGALAAYFLEPESDDGFLDWNFFDTALAVGRPYPVARWVR